MNIGMFLCTYECMFKGMYDHPYVRMYVCMYKTAIVQSMRVREYFEEKLFKFVLTRVRDNESPNGCSEKRHRLSGDPVGSPDFLPSCLPPEDELPA